MRTFNGLQIFTEQLTNSGQLDLRYVRITGNDSRVNLNQGAIVTGQSLTVNSSGIFNNGISVNGNFILNGQQVLISSAGTLFSPTVTAG
jgi:hypothetical protein